MRFCLAPATCLLALLAATALTTTARAQTTHATTEVIPPQYRGVQTRVGGVFVTPIANVPMTATVDLSSMRVLPDGTTELQRTENHIARASSGRIYNERRMMVSVTHKGTPRLLASHVYDPQTRLSTEWTPFSNVAETRTLQARQLAERKPFLVSVPGAADQDLGESVMSGVSVHGLRRTRELPSMSTGAAKPVLVTDEYWYSQDLHLIMLEKHDDPRTGEQIVTVLNVSRAEPEATLFEMPQGYRTVDVTSTASAAAVDRFAAGNASPR